MAQVSGAFLRYLHYLNGAGYVLPGSNENAFGPLIDLAARLEPGEQHAVTLLNRHFANAETTAQLTLSMSDDTTLTWKLELPR